MRTFHVHEAADFLKVSVDTVYRKAESGEIPGAKIGRAWVFLEDDLVSYVRSKYKAPPQDSRRDNESFSFPKPGTTGEAHNKRSREPEYMARLGIFDTDIETSGMDQRGWIKRLPDNATLTPLQAARALGWSVRRLAEDRKGEREVIFEQYGHAVRYRVKDIRRFLKV